MTRYGHLVLSLYAMAIAGLAILVAVSQAPADEPEADVKPAKVKAARALAPNWLIHPKDLGEKPPNGLVKAYASRAVAAGDEIGKADVTAVPSLPANTILLGLPVARKLVTAGEVNAGRRVRVCSGVTALAPQPAVEALICPADQAADCTALVRGEPALLAANDLLLRAAASTCAQQGAENPDSIPPKG
jgi:hypothetical protein